jgi:hypothetical protein
MTIITTRPPAYDALGEQVVLTAMRAELELSAELL